MRIGGRRRMRLSRLRLRRLGLCRLSLGGLLPLHRLMVPDRTPRCCAQYGVMSRHVPRHAANRGAGGASGIGPWSRHQWHQEAADGR